MKAAPCVVPALRQKGAALEEQVKQAQGVIRCDVVGLVPHAGQAQRGGQVDFKKLFGARAGVLPVQAPHGAVGQHAPFDGAVRGDIHPAQVAQHLRRGCVGVECVLAVAPVERAQPAFGLQNGQAVAVAALVFGLAHSPRFFFGAGKQQAVGYRFAAFGVGVDLRQKVIAPAQRGQHLVDDQGLGLRFVEGGGGVHPREYGLQCGFEARQGRVTQFLMWSGFPDAARQEILGKELPLHGVVFWLSGWRWMECKGAVIPDLTRDLCQRLRPSR